MSAKNSLSALTVGTWNVDPVHSTIGFVARHLMISKVRGRFATFTGVITIAADPLLSTVVAEVQTASVTTGDEGRDAHLRNADFFEVEKYPTMTLTTVGLKESGGDHVLSVDLTIKGVTRTVDFALEFEGVEKDPWGGTRSAFSASAEINRKDWGIEMNVALESGGLLVGEKIKLDLDIQAVKA